MMGLIGLVAGCFDDLAECWESSPWWVVPIHRSCTSSPSKVFQSHHLLLIMGEDYWHFRLRQGTPVDSHMMNIVMRREEI